MGKGVILELPKGIFEIVLSEQSESPQFILNTRHNCFHDGELGAHSHGREHEEEEYRPDAREGHLRQGFGVDDKGETRTF